MAIHVLVRFPVGRFLTVAAPVAAVTVGAMAALDERFYRRWLVAPWNIIKYNALGVGGGGQGADLYGVEPPAFYLFNLALNFNVLAGLLLLSPLAALLRTLRSAGARRSGDGSSVWLFVLLSQCWLWLGLMTAKAHKEERFLFVVYPLIAVAAAVSLDEIVVLAQRVLGMAPKPQAEPKDNTAKASSSSGGGGGGGGESTSARRLRHVIAAGVFFVAAYLSGMRIHSMALYYGAPFEVWTRLGRFLQLQHTVTASGRIGSVAPDAVVAAAVLDRDAPLPSAPALSARSTLFGPGLDASSGSLILGVRAKLEEFLRKYEHHTVPHGSEAALAGPRVCVGKEWYRFPASFFLPERTRVHGKIGGPATLHFIRSAFGGQLPLPYLPGPNATAAVRLEFNDENKGDLSRFVPVDSCDYIVDFQLPLPRKKQDAQFEPFFAPSAFLPDPDMDCCDDLSAEATQSPVKWRSIFRAPFLHADSTPSSARAFYIPWYSAKRAVFGWYHILRKEKCFCGVSSQTSE
jgi:alpha-1,2-mannosyltransferase